MLLEKKCFKKVLDQHKRLEKCEESPHNEETIPLKHESLGGGFKMKTWPSISLALILCGLVAEIRSFDLTVLHVNDIHVRLEQTDVYGGPCKDDDRGI